MHIHLERVKYSTPSSSTWKCLRECGAADILPRTETSLPSDCEIFESSSSLLQPKSSSDGKDSELSCSSSKGRGTLCYDVDDATSTHTSDEGAGQQASTSDGDGQHCASDLGCPKDTGRFSWDGCPSVVCFPAAQKTHAPGLEPTQPARTCPEGH